MLRENGLISIETAAFADIPDNARLFASVKDVLWLVLSIHTTYKGFRLIVRSPNCEQRRFIVYSDQMLVISFDKLAGKLAEPVIRNARVVTIPLRDIVAEILEESVYPSIHLS